MKISAPLTACMLAFLFSISLISCSKNESSSEGKAHLDVYLTDDPGNYDKVVIDVKDVQINVTSDTAGGWQSLSTVAASSYDLLRLANDNDTLLAKSDIPTGRLEQMRLILGPNNYVIVDGQQYPLETPSAQQSGLKLNIHQDITSGILYTMLLDFDVAKSVHKTGNNRYMLKPVIRTVFNAVGGSLKGFVKPDSVLTAVYAIQGPDTIASTFTLSGGWMIRGVPAGSYTLSFAPTDTTFVKQTKSVTVTTGNVTMVDTVTLQH